MTTIPPSSTPYVAPGRRTLYRGINMRSRLEATFAAQLDRLDYAWEYEPRCYADGAAQYLPDFVVSFDDMPALFYEVKPPTADTAAALRKMHVIRASDARANLFVVVPAGTYPNQRWVSAGVCLALDPCAHCQGDPVADLRTIPGADRSISP